MLGVDDVQVLCIDQFGKQTGPVRGNKNNRQMCKVTQEIIFDCVRVEVQRGGCAVMSRSCLGFIVVALSV